MHLVFIETWGRGRSFTDTLLVKPGRTVRSPVNHRVFPSNVFMGLSMDKQQGRRIKCVWENQGSHLRMDETFTVLASQGKRTLKAVHHISLLADGVLAYTIKQGNQTA